jgi:hypothetical protein
LAPLDRQASVARQLGRLDTLIGDYWALARSGNFKALDAVTKLIGAQNLILGINQPNAAVVQIEPPRRPTSTDRLEAALARLAAEHKPPDGQAPN